MNQFTTSSKRASEMYSQLGYIMKYYSNDDVADAIKLFFNDFTDEEELLDYFHKNWVAGDKFHK